MKMVDKNGLKINSTLFEFINNEAIPSTNIKIDDFWSKFSKIVHEDDYIHPNLLWAAPIFNNWQGDYIDE